jgi:hypothetical protein
VDIKKKSGSLVRNLIVGLIVGLIVCLVGIIINTIIGDLGRIEGKIYDLNGRVSELKADISNLKEDVSNTGKTIPNVINERILWSEELNHRQHVSAPEVNSVVPNGSESRVDNPSAQIIAPLNPASGKFVSPSSGGEVSTVFNYMIELQNPDNTKYYYIANRIGELYWPKAKIKLQSGKITYTGTSNEWGHPPDGQFSVVLFEVDIAMHENISKWLNGTDFSGIQIDGCELDSVDVVLRR